MQKKRKNSTVMNCVFVPPQYTETITEKSAGAHDAWGSAAAIMGVAFYTQKLTSQIDHVYLHHTKIS